MSDPIRIQAEPVDAMTAAFTVDRPLIEGRAVKFSERGKAAGSPLAEALFAIPGVVGFTIAGSKVTVRKDNAEEWLPTAKQVGAAIRGALAAGGKLFADAALAASPEDEAIRKRVQGLMETEINPAVAGHGGHIELVDVQGGIVYIHMGGGCQGCGMANVTLKQGVERLIRQHIPEVAEVMDTTDHASGANPYYAASKK